MPLDIAGVSKAQRPESAIRLRLDSVENVSDAGMWSRDSRASGVGVAQVLEPSRNVGGVDDGPGLAGAGADRAELPSANRVSYTPKTDPE